MSEMPTIDGASIDDIGNRKPAEHATDSARGVMAIVGTLGEWGAHEATQRKRSRRA
jgi:hypothetical protein